jgi:hypothetical protein
VSCIAHEKASVLRPGLPHIVGQFTRVQAGDRTVSGLYDVRRHAHMIVHGLVGHLENMRHGLSGELVVLGKARAQTSRWGVT